MTLAYYSQHLDVFYPRTEPCEWCEPLGEEWIRLSYRVPGEWANTLLRSREFQFKAQPCFPPETDSYIVFIHKSSLNDFLLYRIKERLYTNEDVLCGEVFTLIDEIDDILLWHDRIR